MFSSSVISSAEVLPCPHHRTDVDGVLVPKSDSGLVFCSRHRRVDLWVTEKKHFVRVPNFFTMFVFVAVEICEFVVTFPRF